MKNTSGMLKMLVLMLITSLMLGCSVACAGGFSDDPDAIEAAAQSVLMLKIYDAEGHLTATGSGFVMFDDMTLVTNHHVIEDGSIIVADSDKGKQYMLDLVVAQDADNDIAILRFVKPTGMTPLDYSLDTVKRGSKVVAIGSPKGLKNTVSMGNVSSTYLEDGVNWIQFTAPISKGSSGGAVFNDAGQVIGISSATYTEGQNLNLAVSMADVIALYTKWDGHNAAAVTTPAPVKAADETAGDEEGDWVEYAPTLLNILYETAAEGLETEESRIVATAAAILDYVLEEPLAYEIGGGDTYYIAGDEESLLFWCPLMENKDNQQAIIILYEIEDKKYSMFTTNLSMKETTTLLAEEVDEYFTLGNKDVAEATEALLEVILSEE